MSLKYILLKKDIAYVYHLVNDQSQNDMICRSFGECIEKLFSKTTDYTLQKSILKNEFSFCEYANTLVVVPVYYLFGIVKLYPEYRIGYVVGIYLIAFAISSTLIGLTLIEFLSFRISSLNAPSEDITGLQVAKASTIALQHPSFNVGNTKTSAQFKY